VIAAYREVIYNGQDGSHDEQGANEDSSHLGKGVGRFDERYHRKENAPEEQDHDSKNGGIAPF